MAVRLARRRVAGREQLYAEEVRRLLDATFTTMRASGDLEPRVSDIVRESGLSNQAFYRHFAGKDELLLAVLEDGQRQLVGYLERRMRRVPDGVPRVQQWIEGVLEQARNRDAAERTRPFAVNGSRLRDRFPVESKEAAELLLEPLRSAVQAAGGDAEHDAAAVYQLTIGTMYEHLLARTTPTRDDIARVVRFALRGIGAPAARAGGSAR
ncbi:MAG: TetR/AcrR family transcriptional regulator [Actinobacteria bacterium]|nr:TetR/AcrR family transcriptional regulator [Actinomycetota bacterium]